MAAAASEAGASRPTLYAHYKTLAELLEACVARAVNATLDAVEAAELGSGPANEALERLIAASWRRLGGLDTLVRAAAEHFPPRRCTARTHRSWPTSDDSSSADSATASSGQTSQPTGS